MINTYNETHLHRALKDIYAAKNKGAQKEVPCGRYIADIILSSGEIIEIQTGTLASLAPKIKFYLAEKRKIKIVFPFITEKYIETINSITGTKKRKKSPKKITIPSIFKELTKIYPFLLEKNFTFEILEVKITEERIDYGSKELSDNSRRKFRKTWNKTGKRLDEIEKSIILHGKISWKKLLPSSLFDKKREWTSKDFCKEVNQFYPKAKKQDILIMLWVFTKMSFFERIGKKGNSFIYKTL